jgi:hypothetical protein
MFGKLTTVNVWVDDQTQEPIEVPYGFGAGFRDPFGNHHRLTRRR